MKPAQHSPAHHSDDFAELVCSNSLRSDELTNAAGLLKEELRRLDSLILACADENRVEAGGALAVAREAFARAVTEKIKSHPKIEVVYGEVTEIPAGKLEYGEDPLSCGKRELKEEIGAAAEEWVDLGKIYPTPAYDTEVIHIYLAKGLSFGEQHLDPGEFLNVERVPLLTLYEQVMAGEILDAKTQIAVLKVKAMLEK